MGLTMHSPGGIPGTSSAVTWNHTAAERQWGTVSEVPLVLKAPLVIAGAALSLTQVGRAGRLLGWAGRTALYHGTQARTWAAYNVYKEATDLKHWLGGGEMEWGLGLKARPLSLMYFPYPLVVPFPWVSLNSVEGSSSQTYQQNGGPSAPLPLVITGGGRESRPLEVSQGTPTRKLRGRSRRGRCPPGYRWNGRRCVKIR